MLDELNLAVFLDGLISRLNAVNDLFIRRIAEQIRRIGELNQSSVNRLIVMRQMGADIAEITSKLQEATRLNNRDVMRLYNRALNDTYTDRRFREFVTSGAVTAETKSRLNRYARAVAMQTANQLTNLSNTTAISQDYQRIIDRGILAVSSGLSDYNSAMRDTVRELGGAGVKVIYDSGYRRRLDTAARQNIIDGVNQINQNASLLMGEELGFDAVEISAHARSAPDHEPVQGLVFLKDQFERMQAGLNFSDVDGHSFPGFRRPIGEWNCMHIAMSFSTEHSVRRYSPQQLQAWRDANAAGCEWGGKHITTYRASQLMRQLETAVRRQKDIANAARISGDDVLRRECQAKINRYAAQYQNLASAAGLPMQKQRMAVDGFKPVKIKP